jgi:hypothetical protein
MKLLGYREFLLKRRLLVMMPAAKDTTSQMQPRIVAIGT